MQIFNHSRTKYYPSLPNILISTLIFAEDRRFYWHPGVDLLALIRAFWKTYFKSERQGGSTIAMQLVRTLTGNYEKTIERKIIEIILAVRLSRKMSKRNIAELYLRVAYFGWKINGINQLLKKLSFDLNSLSKEEAAEIIARLKYPQTRFYSPIRSNQIKIRTDYILNRMKSKNVKYDKSLNDTNYEYSTIQSF